MIRCPTARALMAEALYGELSVGHRRKFEVHLAACAECAREFEGLAATLKVMDTLEPAAPPPGYWAGFWQRLLPRLEPAAVGAGVKDWLERFRLPVVPGAPAWAPLAAALMLVITGIFIGRALYLNRIVISAPAGQVATVMDPAALAEFNQLFTRYLAGSKVALLGLDNFDLEEDLDIIDFPQQRRIYREIIHRGRDLQQHQAAAYDPRLLMLVLEIERLMLPLANSDREDLVWSLQLARDGIQENSVLLKITLTELERQAPGTAVERPAPAPKKSSILI